ncbi:MAG: response regulator [Microcoleaceae cyanobacterium]
MNSKRVLVIDDEDGVRDIIHITLEVVAGWDVFTATGGKEGIAIAQTQQPDAILLDVMMPEMDGLTTFQHLQADPQTQHIPTIFLTAKARMSEQQQYTHLGAVGVITKPFEATRLIEQLQQLLNWTTP